MINAHNIRGLWRANCDDRIDRAAQRVTKQNEENKISVAVFKAMRAEEFDKLKVSTRRQWYSYSLLYASH